MDEETIAILVLTVIGIYMASMFYYACCGHKDHCTGAARWRGETATGNSGGHIYTQLHQDSRPPRRSSLVPGDILTMNQNLANECAICLELFDAGDKTRVLDCGHYYHQDCVDPWLKDDKKCPKCRGENIV